MRRTGITAVLFLLLLALSGGTAWPETNFDNAPSGAHYANRSSEPVCTVNETDNTVSCTGTKIAGVGNTNATVSLTVFASADIVCHNPGRNSKVVEPHSSTVTDDLTPPPLTPSKNGQLAVPLLSEGITEDEVTTAFTCPNPNWTEEVTDIDITGFTYSLTFAGFDQPAILITG